MRELKARGVLNVVQELTRVLISVESVGQKFQASLRVRKMTTKKILKKAFSLKMTMTTLKEKILKMKMTIRKMTTTLMKMTTNDDDVNEDDDEDDEPVEPKVEKYNRDTVVVLESLLQKAKAPAPIMKAYKSGFYERCTSWLKKSKGVSINLTEGFSKKESIAISKYLKAVGAPKKIHEAFDRGQYSMVAAYVKSKKRK